MPLRPFMVFSFCNLFFYNKVNEVNYMNTIIKKVNKNIYIIDQQMVRCFVIVGKKEVLVIDTGAREIDFLLYVRQITSKPVKLCLTHGDIDHIANLNQFDKVFLHKDELNIIKASKEIEMIAIDEGYVFDLGEVLLEVIHTPGHTPGSISLLDRKNKILFSGDTVSYGPIYMYGQNRNIHLYMETLKRLEKMFYNNEFKEIYPCHNICPIPANVISELIECVKGILDKSIVSKDAKIPFQMTTKPQLYQYKQCGILYIDKQYNK